MVRAVPIAPRRRYASRCLTAAQTPARSSRSMTTAGRRTMSRSTRRSSASRASSAAAARQVRPYWKRDDRRRPGQRATGRARNRSADAAHGAHRRHRGTGHDARLVAPSLGLVGLIPIYVAGNFLGEYMAARVGASVCNDLRLAGFWRLQALSVELSPRPVARRSAVAVQLRSRRRRARRARSSRSRCPAC